jgi:hypothetical protein
MAPLPYMQPRFHTALRKGIPHLGEYGCMFARSSPNNLGVPLFFFLRYFTTVPRKTSIPFQEYKEQKFIVARHSFVSWGQR